MQKIRALTISKIGTEFIIHVPEEYDYRYEICYFLDTLPLTEEIK